MSLQVSPDVESSVRALIGHGGYASENDVLRNAIAALKREKDIEAIQRGNDDLNAGRYRPFEEVDAEIRKKFGFKAASE
jgi:Arc/MetJ-type ribon-helix-helix transcriptional regulator